MIFTKHILKITVCFLILLGGCKKDEEKNVSQLKKEVSTEKIPQQTVTVGIEGDIELLRLIADGYEANFEKLKTWQGEASITDYFMMGEGQEKFSLNRRHKAEFLIDRDLDAARWKFHTLERTELKGGKKYDLGPELSSGMIKGEYDYSLNIPDDEKIKRSLFVFPKGRLPRNFESKGFNPVSILKEVVPIPIPERLRFYYEKAYSQKISAGIITRKGDVVVFETRSKAEKWGNIKTRYVFDLSKGCNLLEFGSFTDLYETFWALDYEEVDGVFVMNKVSLTHEEKSPGKQRISKREAILSNNIVNKPVDPGDFEFDKLGLRPGDEIIEPNRP